MPPAAMGGEVKTSSSLAPASRFLISGVRPQALVSPSGQLDPFRVMVGWGLPIDTVGCAAVDAVALRCRRDMEAVVFSARCGNHAAIGASSGQSFFRLSGGA